jgi:hypothetical protein
MACLIQRNPIGILKDLILGIVQDPDFGNLHRTSEFPFLYCRTGLEMLHIHRVLLNFSVQYLSLPLNLSNGTESYL